MEKSDIVLCDTNILIELYKGNSTIVKSLKSIGQEKIAVSIITTGELLYGALNKKELTQINKDLSQLKILEIGEEISNEFIKLMSTYSLSHNLSLPDGLIAATAIVNDIPFYTLNTKDFKFISGLKLWG